MANAFHVHVSKSTRIFFWTVIGIYSVVLITMWFLQKWDIVVMGIGYLLIPVGIYCFTTPFIRITQKNKLFVGSFAIDVPSIYLLEEQPNKKVKIHYLFDGQERSYLLPVAHYEIDLFKETMKQLNPAIQINS